MVPNMAWSKKTVLKILRINPFVFSRWYDRGFISPSIQPGGRGKANRWSAEDIIKVLVFKKVHECGFTLEESKRIAYEDLNDLLLGYALPRVDTYREKKKGSVIDGRRPFLHQLPRPVIMILYLRKPDGRIEGHRVSSEANLTDLYEEIRECEGAVILNLAKIVEEILDRVEKETGGEDLKNH